MVNISAPTVLEIPARHEQQVKDWEAIKRAREVTFARQLAELEAVPMLKSFAQNRAQRIASGPDLLRAGDAIRRAEKNRDAWPAVIQVFNHIARVLKPA